MVARGVFYARGGGDEDALVDVPRAAVAGARGRSIEHKRGSLSGGGCFQGVSFGRVCFKRPCFRRVRCTQGGSKLPPKPPNQHIGGSLLGAPVSEDPLLEAPVLRGPILGWLVFVRGLFQAPDRLHRRFENIVFMGAVFLAMSLARRGIKLPLPQAHRQVLDDVLFISPPTSGGRRHSDECIIRLTPPPLPNGYFGSFLNISCFFKFDFGKPGPKGLYSHWGGGVGLLVFYICCLSAKAALRATIKSVAERLVSPVASHTGGFLVRVAAHLEPRGTALHTR